MKKYTKVYFITVNGQPTYIGVTPNKKLTLMTRGEAVLASATTAEPVFIDTEEGLKEFSRFYRKPIKSHHVRNGVLTVAGLALVLGTSSYALNSPTTANILDSFKNAPEALSGQMINQDQGSDVELETKEVNEAETEKANEAEVRTFDSVLAESTSEKQKQVVGMMADYIRYFNGDFANTYKETVELTDEKGNLTGEKIEIKPALKWEYEVPALTIAYNDYSAQKLHTIFNGADLNAEILDRDYKVATLQLFASYVISDRSMPVNLANLIESDEGKAFVQKYEDMFYSIKEAKTDEEKAQKVNEFYAELYKDFPIDEVSKMDFSENEVGIAHSEESLTTFQGRDLEKYKLAITPMISAIEVMYQNLEIDPTLQDDAIRYFNLLGECNLAYKEFVKAETASECGELDETLADFKELSDLIIDELRDANAYVIDDNHRELSFLTKFQEYVNGHFNIIDGEMDGTWWYYTDYDEEVIITYSDPVIRKESHTTYKKVSKKWETDDRDEAVKHVGEKAVKEAEEKVDKEIEKENQEAKKAAEKEADKEQKKQQDKEDKKREQLEKEVQQEDERFNKEIEDANKQIEKNNDNNPNNDKPINENDFTGHEVDFDDEHSNSNGDLDNSVKDITTDGTGANQDLPDSNQTGEEFDDRTDSAPVETESKKEESKPAETHEESKPAEQPKEESKPAETHHEESKPAEQPKEESKPAETNHEESKPAEQPKEESKPAEVHFESNENDQYEDYTTTGSISDEELVNTYIANLEAASPEELAAIRRI